MEININNIDNAIRHLLAKYNSGMGLNSSEYNQLTYLAEYKRLENCTPIK